MSSFTHQLVMYRDMLKQSFEHAIRTAVDAAYKASDKPQEPDIIAKLVLEASLSIGSTLRSVLSPVGITTKVSSIFCHQRPMVEFTDTKEKCELGDVLFVHQHQYSDGSYHHNALLLQAKMCGNMPYRITTPNERVQLRLYQQWPMFKYFRTLNLHGKTRDVQPKCRHRGAQYLLINRDGIQSWENSMFGFPHMYCMAVCMAGETLYAHYSLADELIDFFLGKSGRLFFRTCLDCTEWPCPDKSGKPVFRMCLDCTGWSRVIWDILEYAYNQAVTFTRRNVGIEKSTRVGGDRVAFLCLSESGAVSDSPGGFAEALRRLFESSGSFDHGGFDYPPQEHDNGDRESGGLSVIFIETSETRD
ncbi:hypothetical protein D6833_00110 [Candidatus Parcubacteria bacterium]|nr:MAG: hypothetical protein D6833_00110 [Candidatus Parcubacteria bacterium]